MRTDRTSTLRHPVSCHMASKSSSFPGLLYHKMLQAQSKLIAFDRAVDVVKQKKTPESFLQNASPNSRTIFTSSEYHVT